MKTYRVRLEAQDGSGHFRQTTGTWPDKDAAKRHCEREELKRVLFELPPQLADALCAKYGVESVEDLPKAPPRGASDAEKVAWRELAPEERSRLHAHYQQQPYKVVKVEVG